MARLFGSSAKEVKVAVPEQKSKPADEENQVPNEAKKLPAAEDSPKVQEEEKVEVKPPAAEPEKKPAETKPVEQAPESKSKKPGAMLSFLKRRKL